jgi:tetratricopeptide (TPR) repeat protein/tRNA A-37 threonylcarbamoyl transferase component Bud32
MQAERWSRVKEIFAAALEMDAAERARYVAEACAGDAELHAEVSSLLESHETVGDFIEQPAAVRGGLAPERRSRDWIGRRLGVYRIVAEAGCGGMSQVFAAVRDDDQYEQRVAIKLLKPGLDSAALLRRFKAERQILAQLSHPNIAHLLDGGTTEDGTPYFVMEFIEGQPIDVYCDERQLGVNERLDLFRTLCAAVHHVHRHLMVHGDLKGSNVLVTEHGVVKLLDFGIAQLSGPAPHLRRDDLGGTPFVALTPEYASPEQMRGEPITTASDVYSLGVLLYRLLSGSMPQDAKGAFTWERAQQVSECSIAAPSIKARSAAGLHSAFAPALRGDLDSIVLKAMQQLPEERYGSAEQLSDDLHRYLRGFPVTAHPDTGGYRLRKFLQRHKAAAVTVGLFLAALIAGIVATSWQAQVARAERGRAQRHFDQVHDLTTLYLFDVYDAVEKLPGGTSARKLLVENSVTLLAGLEQEARDSPRLQRELAAAYERLGDVQGDYIGANLGDTQGAIENYRRALNIRRALVERDPSLESRRDLVRSCVVLSELRLAQGATEEALGLAREAVQLADTLLRERDATLVDRRYAALSYMTLGWEQGLLGEVDAGMEAMHKARAWLQQLAAEQPDSAQARWDLMLIFGRMGNVYLDGIRPLPAKALPLYEQTLQMVEPLAEEDPNNADLQRARAFTLATIGLVQNELGAPRQALANHDRALEIIERLRAADDVDRLAPLAAAFVLNGRGESRLLLGEHVTALEDFSRAEEIVRNDPPQTTDISEIRLLPGMTYANLARAAALLAGVESIPANRRSKHVQDAREWSRRAIELIQPLVSDPLVGNRGRRILSEVSAATAALSESTSN